MNGGFFKKYRCLFETECVPAPNGECLVWPRKPKEKWIWGCQNTNVPYLACGDAQLHIGLLTWFITRLWRLLAKILISHLRHDRLCFRVKHLSAEPHAVQNARQKCVNRHCCSGHLEFPDCVLYLKFLILGK